jgi:membrane protease YdiL (CAAX protease family)
MAESGGASPAPAAARQCPGCQRQVRPATRFCPGCGHALLAAAPAAGAATLTVSAPGEAARSHFAEHWAEIKFIGWLFGLLLGSSLVYGMAARGNDSPWPTVAVQVVDALIVLAALWLRRRRLAFAFKLHLIGAQAWGSMAAVAVVFLASMSAYFWALERLGVPMSSATGLYVHAGWPLWAILLLISVMPAVFEELAFRGVIQSSLERVLNGRDAWLIQAALFSVLHLAPIIFPSHFIMGLCFGYLRQRSRCVYPGMLLHAAWNALIVLNEI